MSKRFATRRSHVLAQAVLELWPGATFAIGPPIENGFYYDFELPDGATFNDDDLERIEAKMREIVAADQPFIRSSVTGRGLELMSDHPYKQEIIERSAPGADDADLGPRSQRRVISFYRNSDAFVDMCVGPTCPRPAGWATSSS